MSTDSLSRAPARTLDGERLLTVFVDLVPVLGAALPPDAEVVLHDLARLPDSEVARHGRLSPDTPALDPAELAALTDHSHELDRVLPDGRRVRASAFVVRDIAGVRVGALVITVDLTGWERMRSVLDAVLGARPVEVPDVVVLPPSAPAPVAAPQHVHTLAQELVARAIAAAGVPVEEMKKEQKVRVVGELQEQGLFLLKEAVEMVGSALGVTRFTVYNYLNELSGGDDLPGSREH